MWQHHHSRGTSKFEGKKLYILKKKNHSSSIYLGKKQTCAQSPDISGLTFCFLLFIIIIIFCIISFDLSTFLVFYDLQSFGPGPGHTSSWFQQLGLRLESPWRQSLITYRMTSLHHAADTPEHSNHFLSKAPHSSMRTDFFLRFLKL